MTTETTQIATALLMREGRALLVLRGGARRAYPNCWGLVGGHVEPGETPRQAVSRECFEELGTRIADPRRIPMTVTAAGVEMHTFLVTRWTTEPRNAATDEHDEIRWFAPHELADLPLAHPESLPDILNAMTRSHAGSSTP
ncbi:acetyltransferase [Brachybacterium phenoliresistens]|uniref:Acetyltransferase n=2 Tax=Brachybacterium phenoliresistens TaxID=396014 RepID=Z9JT02_9MICO|nr:acetyltransferase [Brachybacterium phenoliresistens]